MTADDRRGYRRGPTPANPTDTLHTFKAKATYYHDRKYGGTLGYFSTTGSADSGPLRHRSEGNAIETRQHAATLSSSTICRSKMSA